MCVRGEGFVRLSTGTPGGQERALDHLELEFQGAFSHPMWALETKLESSAKAASALYY